jgi:hypothetical protein
MTTDIRSGDVRGPRPSAPGRGVVTVDRGAYPDDPLRAVDAVTPDFELTARLLGLIPREAVEKFRPHCERLVQAILQEIQLAVPEYAQLPEGPRSEDVSRSIGYALNHCYEQIGSSNGVDPQWPKVFRELGETAFADGRSVDSLQAAYRVGGRVAWRYIAELGPAHDVPAEILYTCAEAIFAVVDEISALSVEGYCAALHRASGSLALRRRLLLEQILADPPVSSEQLAGLAEAAQWTLPESVSMVALEPRADQNELAVPSLQGDALADFERPQPCILVPHPQNCLGTFEPALQGWRVAIGPRVPLGEAGASLRLAQRATALVRQGAVPDAPVVHCTDHLLTLWLLGDEFVMRQLNDHSLAPLCDLTVKQRARLAETLLLWLQLRGSAPELADKLGVHPQTIRYRMNQLEHILGDRLRDPDERLSLEIALRAENLLRRAESAED